MFNKNGVPCILFYPCYKHLSTKRTNAIIFRALYKSKRWGWCCVVIIPRFHARGISTIDWWSAALLYSLWGDMKSLYVYYLLFCSNPDYSNYTSQSCLLLLHLPGFIAFHILISRVRLKHGMYILDGSSECNAHM